MLGPLYTTAQVESLNLFFLKILMLGFDKLSSKAQTFEDFDWELVVVVPEGIHGGAI